ncbi:hypothetical protein MSSIT_2324 [Methanosarcina siciliae T4/M]|uniref:NACHT domain-containing protein n=1 Tax=Methanosarcina siciliae T4/M TaxID=1434120 RepID=A0A0E3P5S2_9EURY|nr:NACHT domain-containing protein [Methanosarcina siciliae]AKB29043.1 hypothetical protein MSSIT_2324 [Methanosarcina siciliae T4/M]
MDPSITQNILLSLFANGLTSLICYLGVKLEDLPFEDEDSVSSLISKTNFDIIIEEFINAEELPEIDSKSICEFFTSPEVESIVLQIYAYQFSSSVFNESNSKSIEEIREEFNLVLSLYFGIDKEKNSKLMSQIFMILIAGCEETLNKWTNEGKLSAHEAESKYRFKAICGILQTVNKNIELLSGKTKPNIHEIHKFVEKYRSIVGKRCERIRSASYNSKQRVPINDIYVCPDFIVEGSTKVTNRPLRGETRLRFACGKEIINLNQLLSHVFRIVLLGDPGAGKTTFVQKISHELITRYSERIFSGTCVTPTIVVLRDFQVKNFEKGISILDFIAEEANSNYQIPVPKYTFEYLLLNGHMLLIFDGLDELLDIKYREKIVDEVESFCTLYPSVPVIVTSRKVGYEQAPLRDDMFKTIELAPFNVEKINEYVTKWFALDDDLTNEEKNSKSESFMRESQIASDIRSNSLMLSLMCSIYLEENYIPENRPKVYQKCSEMLFEKWDGHRGISSNTLIPNAKIKPLIAYLAHYIFTKESIESSQEGVTEKELIEICSEYLFDTIYEDIDEAERAAEDFIDFCRGRAWVFTDIGTKNGENSYQFTHRTFLEYFTAYWIVRKYPIEEICEILLPKICKREWDTVAQLVFQIKYESAEDGDTLFKELIKKSRIVKNEERFNLMDFASKCLKFIIPRPQITREIVTECFNMSVNSGLELIEVLKNHKKELGNETYELSSIEYHPIDEIGEYVMNSDYDPIEPILLIRDTLLENRNVISKTIRDLIIDTFINGNENESILSLEICLNIPKDSPFVLDKTFYENKENENFWELFSGETFQCCFSNKSDFILRNLHLSIGCYLQNKLALNDIIDVHGLKFLLYDYSYIITPRTRYSAIADRLLLTWVSGSQINSDELKKIGVTFLLSSTRCIKINENILYMEMFIKSIERVTEIKKNNILNQDPDSLFGVFCLFACMLELRVEEKVLSIIQKIISFSDPLGFIFATWLGVGDPDQVENRIEKIGFTDDQKSFVIKWAKKEIHILELNSENDNDISVSIPK